MEQDFDPALLPGFYSSRVVAAFKRRNAEVVNSLIGDVQRFRDDYHSMANFQDKLVDKHFRKVKEGTADENNGEPLLEEVRSAAARCRQVVANADGLLVRLRALETI